MPTPGRRRGPRAIAGAGRIARRRVCRKCFRTCLLALPNNETTVSAANPILNPTKYGLDFWKSLSGELVTVRNPTVLAAPVSSKGFTWVVGDWAATGRNTYGGLTISAQGMFSPILPTTDDVLAY